MSDSAEFVSATPVLASLDLPRTAEFYCSHLGFIKVYLEPGVYGVVTRDGVSLHFWNCAERHIAENTSCRIRVNGVASLYQHCVPLGIVHPRAPLEEKPWGSTEFSIVDPDGNLVTFSEPTG